jgi:DNA-binding CsgD family transcriptional regulator
VLIAAETHSRAGDPTRATALLEEARAAAVPGPDRAAVLVGLAWAPRLSYESVIALYRQALAEAQGDSVLEATIHRNFVRSMRWGGEIELALEHAERGVQAASRVDDPALRCLVLGEYGRARFDAGLGIDTEAMEKAVSLERSLDAGRLEGGPTERLAEQFLWAADTTRARSLFQEELSVSSRTDPYLESIVLMYLGLTEWRAGNWEEADRYTARAMDLASQLGWLEPWDEFPAAVIAAHRGRIDEARASVQGAAARAEAEGTRLVQAHHAWVLGFIELSFGDSDSARVHLARAYELMNDLMLEPAARLELGDLLEARIATGELDEAEEVLTTWEERAEALDRAWALAILARARGLLLAARGDLDGAFASFERALAEHGRSTDPFHQARTLLALGRTQRRAKQRAAARTTLQKALAAFEHVGAPLWAEHARAELARIGGRAASNGELTEAEQRIAALVAEGRTNREVADSLFLTVHSVETALTRVYRKLGVRSRAELAHVFVANS